VKRVTHVIGTDGITGGVFHNEILIAQHVNDVTALPEGK